MQGGKQVEGKGSVTKSDQTKQSYPWGQKASASPITGGAKKGQKSHGLLPEMMKAPSIFIPAKGGSKHKGKNEGPEECFWDPQAAKGENSKRSDKPGGSDDPEFSGDWTHFGFQKNKGGKGPLDPKNETAGKGKLPVKKGRKIGYYIPTGEEPPVFEARDREMFCHLVNKQPEELKQYIAFSFLQMPLSASTQDIGRMLFQNYGALITEVCHLFQCSNLLEVSREIRAAYRLPKDGKSAKGNDSNSGNLSGPIKVMPAPTSRLEVPSSWVAAQAIPICVSKEVQTDPWNEKMICECMKTIPRNTAAETALDSAVGAERMWGQKAIKITQIIAQADNLMGGETGERKETVLAASPNVLPNEPLDYIQTNQSMRVLVPPVGMPLPDFSLQIAKTSLSEKALKQGADKDLVADEIAGSPNKEPLPDIEQEGEIESLQAQQERKTEIKTVEAESVKKIEENKKCGGELFTSIMESVPGSSVDTKQYGSRKKRGDNKWEVVIWRVPTKMTAVEREFSRRCSRAYSPSTKKHNFHPIASPQMIRCPIGGGTCQNSLINIKTPKPAAFTHFSIHHRDEKKYEIKIKGSHNNFLYTTFPGGGEIPDEQTLTSFEEMTQSETAGVRRRRQRLYPRLAGEEQKSGGPQIGGTMLTVEELLSGTKSGNLHKKDGGGNVLGKKKEKETIEVDNPTQEDTPEGCKEQGDPAILKFLTTDTNKE